MGPPVSLANLGTPGAPPQRLGRYEILGRLAAGGMAEILLGRVLGPHGFERPVAMKRILPHLAGDRAFVEMFVAEARIAASIRHARVAQVHELASFDGQYFLVMEYVEGENVGGLMRRLWLRGEPLDRVLAAHIVAEACAGLHAAHELTDAGGVGRQVVHRDVSPQNVMITYAGEVKVLDFGIAKASDSARTQAGQVKGKCEYMSPEQCRGEPLDRQSDIFSLGVLLYELTVGKRLFKRDNALLAFHAVCFAPIPRPTEIDPSYPQVLETICLRTLARDRRDRYATMLELRRDLVAAVRAMIGAEDRAGEEEMLAGLMARLFADRIQEKRDMLRLARTDATLDSIPPAEVDSQVEIPGVAFPPPAPVFEDAHASTAPVARRRGLAIAAGALGATLLGALGLWLAARARTPDAAADVAPPARHSDAKVVLQPVPPSPLAPSPRPAPPVPPATISLTVESIPPGADVFVGGELRGNAPCAIALPRAGEPLAVSVSRDGFNPVAERVVPTADQKLVVHLRPVSTAAPRPAPPRAPPTPAKDPDKKPAVFERFD